MAPRFARSSHLSAFLFVVLALIINLACQAEPVPSASLSETAKAALTRVLRDAVSRGDMPGVAALVVGTNGVLYEGAAGKLGGERDVAMPVDAVFQIASMTKPVTSVAIMQLVEAGKIKLDDPVSNYLPGFDHLQVITRFHEADATYESRPAKRPMTIRHLLTHTSGIAYGFVSPVVTRLGNASKKQEWQLPLLSDPGEQWHYGPSTAVLGMIVEKVSGQTLEDYFQQHIFKPLGMTDTSYAVPEGKRERIPANHQRENGRWVEVPRRQPVPSTPTPPFLGDGGLYSTVSDYGKFMQMFLNNGRAGSATILKPATVKEMEANNIGSVIVELQPITNPSQSKPFPLGAGHDKFGLGFEVAAGPQAAGYRSNGSVSWAGIFNTEFWIDPVKKVGVVMMMQGLPFYDDGAISTLRTFEHSVYQNLR
jgi:methyl acetate hydrolase